MNRIKKLFCLALLLTVVSACAPKMVTKIDEFPLMYEENPASILILPPINESTAADAKEYYSTTIQVPLAFAGYYTFPYPITTEILQMEGLYDTELLVNVPLIKFKEYFGADAVLFTTIKKWDLTYMVLAASLTVAVDCRLKSTTTDRILWEYTGSVVVDLSGGNSGGGLAGLIIQAILTAANAAATDYVPYAQQVNYQALRSMPYGKYHPQHSKDRDTKIVDQTPDNNDQAVDNSGQAVDNSGQTDDNSNAE